MRKLGGQFKANPMDQQEFLTDYSKACNLQEKAEKLLAEARNQQKQIEARMRMVAAIPQSSQSNNRNEIADFVEKNERIFSKTDVVFLARSKRSTAEVAEYLGLDISTVTRQRDKYPHEKQGRTYLFCTLSVVKSIYVKTA